MNSVEQNPNETETPAATGIRLWGAKIDEETTYHDAMAGSHVSTILYVSIFLVYKNNNADEQEREVSGGCASIHSREFEALLLPQKTELTF